VNNFTSQGKEVNNPEKAESWKSDKMDIIVECIDQGMLCTRMEIPLIMYNVHNYMCVISTSRSSVNTDSIRQAKVIPTLGTNKQVSQ
jgi:hypothetical protein